MANPLSVFREAFYNQGENSYCPLENFDTCGDENETSEDLNLDRGTCPGSGGAVGRANGYLMQRDERVATDRGAESLGRAREWLKSNDSRGGKTAPRHQ